MLVDFRGWVFALVCPKAGKNGCQLPTEESFERFLEMVEVAGLKLEMVDGPTVAGEWIVGIITESDEQTQDQGRGILELYIRDYVELEERSGTEHGRRLR